MCLIKNNDGVFEVYFVIFSDFGINQVVVRHQDEVGLQSSILLKVIRADLMPDSELVKILDVVLTPFKAIGIEVVASVAVEGAIAWITRS